MTRPDLTSRIRSPLLCPLSYGRSAASCAVRAGEGNRTPITSLEGWGSTFELHPPERSLGACGRGERI